MSLSRNPAELEARVASLPAGGWVIIDEIQKIPALLDEVHRLIEERKLCFALSGSSARKLKRGGANLLAGRALMRNLLPFTSAELGARFDLDRALEWGTMPLVVNFPQDAAATLSAYVQTYLKEEIREEGLVRKLGPFVRFLAVAGQMNGQILNLEALAREAEVKRNSAQQWFEILEESFLGFWLPAWRPGLKVKEIAHPRFYWFDAGVARAAAGLLDQSVESVWKGFAFEALLMHEIRSYFLGTTTRFPELFYYRTGSGVEVDLVLQTRKKTISTPEEVVCFEFKSAKKWDRRWEEGMRGLMSQNRVKVRACYGVYRGKDVLTYDGIHVLPVEQFLARLHAGELF